MQAVADLGFTPVQAGIGGVSIRGSPQLYESTFQTEVKWKKIAPPVPYFVDEPVIPESLDEFFGSVYIPTKPEYFDSNLA